MKIVVNLLFALLALAATTAVASAQGIALQNKAVVLYGEASNCSQPALVDITKVAEATPEYKEIKSQSLDSDSAKYKLLARAMLKRIKEACKAVAEDQGHDLVVRKGDVANAKGLAVTDLTDKVVEYLEKHSDAP